MIIPVILSGGSGRRLWPLSRKLYPKQFLHLTSSERTVFQDTLLRLPKNCLNPVVICNEEHRFLAAEQLREINISPNSIILEPIAKNTAPAITLAALKLVSNNEDPILLVLPADHVIEDINTFHESLEIATNLAEQNKLVTFGINPHNVETGYGYIETEKVSDYQFLKVISFKEKPDYKTAKNYLKSGNFLWNSGMFMFKASIFLDELKEFEIDIYTACRDSLESNDKDLDLDFIRINQNSFMKCPEKSIDYAIMEQTSNAVVVPLDAKWSDIGSWNSLMDIQNKDINGNVSQGDIVLNDVKNTYAYGSNKLIAVSGVSDLIIIDTPDSLLVMNKHNVEHITKLISKLNDLDRNELDEHRKVYRPWGHYDLLDQGNNFKVKRIVIRPGAKLSLQKHNYRAEHWVVISGIATIICGNKTFYLSKNESTFIPKGEIHRLINEEKVDLEIIEIQTGEYFGEDDIIRLEDHYHRKL
jgi:mannose-1-phosphate guanylyltransferase/mannose-6-phosphate isomerase